MPHPTISAVTIVYNRADLLPFTIKSVLDQTHPVSEFVIVDDGSEDDLRSVVERFQDPRIIYHRIDHLGILSKLRNIALGKASCDYVAFIDSDDLWHPDKIRLSVEAALKEDAVLVFSDCQIFDSERVIIPAVGHGLPEKVSVFRELLDHNLSLAFGTNFFFRRLPGITVFDEDLSIGDHDFIMRLSATQKTTFIGKVLNFIRRHPGNHSHESGKNVILCPLEYNRTIAKLLASGHISAKEYNKIRAANYIKIGFAYFQRLSYRRANRYVLAALGLHLTWNYVKIAAKVIVLGLLYRIPRLGRSQTVHKHDDY